MRLVSFRMGGQCSFGAVSNNVVADLGLVWPTLRAALEVADIADLERAARTSPRRLALSGLSYLQPITNPDKIICVGLNYRGHAEETGSPIPEQPGLFIRFPNAQVGHNEPVWRPYLSEHFDFEGELAVVIGRSGRHIPVDRALDHVAGYSCFADNALRDYQRHSTQATAGKNFRNSGAFGPWLVTADEVPDPSRLSLVTRLNGAEVQRDSLANLIFSVPELIAYISAFTDLVPGDVIATGTPAGVGIGRTPPLFMRSGDSLEVEISSIGTLRNSIIDEPVFEVTT